MGLGIIEHLRVKMSNCERKKERTQAVGLVHVLFLFGACAACLSTEFVMSHHWFFAA